MSDLTDQIKRLEEERNYLIDEIIRLKVKYENHPIVEINVKDNLELTSIIKHR